MHVGNWMESQKEYKDVGRWILLRWILEKEDGVVGFSPHHFTVHYYYTL
jgi:hypothetical protein